MQIAVKHCTLQKAYIYSYVCDTVMQVFIIKFKTFELSAPMHMCIGTHV